MSAAHQAVARAIKAGRLPAKTHCFLCGAPSRLWHHWSYEPEHHLDVVQLCRHGKVHAGVFFEPLRGTFRAGPDRHLPPWSGFRRASRATALFYPRCPPQMEPARHLETMRLLDGAAPMPWREIAAAGPRGPRWNQLRDWTYACRVGEVAWAARYRLAPVLLSAAEVGL